MTILNHKIRRTLIIIYWKMGWGFRGHETKSSFVLQATLATRDSNFGWLGLGFASKFLQETAEKLSSFPEEFGPWKISKTHGNVYCISIYIYIITLKIWWIAHCHANIKCITYPALATVIKNSWSQRKKSEQKIMRDKEEAYNYMSLCVFSEINSVLFMRQFGCL